MDNATTNGFLHSNIRLKRSKAWDMRYHWMRDQQIQNLFRYYWAKGDVNNADYFTKHHSPNHHRKMRPTYILHGNNIEQITKSVISQTNTLIPRGEGVLMQRYPISQLTTDNTHHHDKLMTWKAAYRQKPQF